MKTGFDRKRKGSVLMLVAVSMVTLIAVAGLGIDVGMMYRMRAQMQLAADAASLAAAVQVSADQLATAKKFSSLNGFTDGVGGCTIGGGMVAGTPTDYQITIAQPYLTLFVGLVGAKKIDLQVQSVARYSSQMPISINGGGTPGNASNLATLSCFGPYALFGNGDAYSTMFLNDGTANPCYNRNGYDFVITIPSNYQTLFSTNKLVVQLYDPDCRNSGSNSIDEIRDPNSGSSQYPITLPAGFVKNTKTQYTVFTVPNGLKDLTTQTQIAQATYCTETATERLWVTPAGFSIDLTAYPGVTQFRLNAKAIAGSSENGYFLRAGPPSLEQTTDWTTTQFSALSTEQQAALDNIKATGYLPLNINSSGTLDINLGTLPAANGVPYNVSILKFDTDVGASRWGITYTDTNSIINYQGENNTAGAAFKTDTIPIPSDYPGGTLTAHYTGGASDTSSWSMTYLGNAVGNPGKVKLIQ